MIKMGDGRTIKSYIENIIMVSKTLCLFKTSNESIYISLKDQRENKLSRRVPLGPEQHSLIAIA